jgi:hypothetical protein
MTETSNDAFTPTTTGIQREPLATVTIARPVMCDAQDMHCHMGKISRLPAVWDPLSERGQLLTQVQLNEPMMTHEATGWDVPSDL